MKKEDSLADAPERSRAEFIRASASLQNAIGKPRAHVVHQKIREQGHGFSSRSVDTFPGVWTNCSNLLGSLPRIRC